MKTALNPYLNFNAGDTSKAMMFYQSVLGGELKMQTFGESGMPVSEAEKENIVHAELKTDGIDIMASDAHAGQPVTFGDNIHMSLVGEDEVSLTQIFNKLADGGKVDMPLAKQFWGDTYGQITDKFGVHWMVNISSGEQPQK